MKPRVSVAIVGFRNADDIQRCLAALGLSTYRDFDVVVCENGGREAYETLAAATPSRLPAGQPVRLVLAPGNLGFAGGVNRCLAEAPDADAWWVLNPDTQPRPEALALLVARLSEGHVEAVGCTLYLPDGKVQSHGGRWRPWLARAESIGIGDRLDNRPDAECVERQQSYLNGASMLVGRRYLETVGPMREDYFLYCEEVEWCLRARSRGMRLGFAPDALVLHVQGTTTGAAEAYRRRPRLPIFLGERNRMLLTRDCFPYCLPVAAIAAMALLTARYLRRGAWRQWIYGVAGLWAGLLNKRGPPEWTRN